MWVISHTFGEGVEHPSDDSRDCVDEAEWGKEGKDHKADDGLNEGEHVCCCRRHGATGNGTISATRDKTIEGSVYCIVPGTGRTPHEERAQEKNQVHVEKMRKGCVELKGCVEGAEKMREIEVPESIGSVKSHQLYVWKKGRWNVTQPTGLVGLNWVYWWLVGCRVWLGRGLADDGGGGTHHGV